MVTHISKLESLSRNLKQLGEPISDLMLMTKILMTLPENYKHFYSAWDSIPNVDKTLSNLSSRFMVEETRQTQGYDTHRDTASSSAFSAKKQIKKNIQKLVILKVNGTMIKNQASVIIVKNQHIGNVNAGFS